MKKRLFFTVVLSIIMILSYSFISQYVLPSSSSDLAIQQIQEDGSREIMRIQENYQNYFDIIFYVVWAFVFIIVWKSKIDKTLKFVFNK